MLEREMLVLSMTVDTASNDKEILENEDLETSLFTIEKVFQGMANKISSLNALDPPKVVISREINHNINGLYGTMSSKTNTLTIYPIKSAGNYYFSFDYISLLDTFSSWIITSFSKYETR